MSFRASMAISVLLGGLCLLAAMAYVLTRPIDERIIVPGRLERIVVDVDGRRAADQGDFRSVSIVKERPRYYRWVLDRDQVDAWQGRDDPPLRQPVYGAAFTSDGDGAKPIVDADSEAAPASDAVALDPRELKRAAEDVGALVGAELAGSRVRVVGSGVVITHPELIGLSGNRVVSADGERIRTLLDLERVARRAGPGAKLDLVLTGGRPAMLQVPAADSAARRAYGVVGALATTASPRVSITPDVSFRPTRAVGDSAGLAYALAAYQALSGTDLADGRTIVAAGQVTESGQVLRVQGIAAKAAAAARGGADVLVVPQDLEPLARRHAGDVEVVGVSTVDVAIEALQ